MTDFIDGVTAVYHHYDNTGTLLYVGISFNTRKRIKEHNTRSIWWQYVRTITVNHYPSRDEAREAEAIAIIDEKPLYNKIIPVDPRKPPFANHQEVVRQLYNHLVNLYRLSKGSPIHERYLVMFLVRRAPSDQISVIFNIAEQIRLISRVEGTDKYIPLKPFGL